jgi:hypothetical protein
MARSSWTKKARCLSLDTNLFFDKYEESSDIRKAIDSLCKKCPVQRQCLANAISRQEYGVWGGVYFENGKISKEFNNHKKQDDWFNIWLFASMEIE